MPPPINAIARPRFTARTVGLMKMYCQPSRSSCSACAGLQRVAVSASDAEAGRPPMSSRLTRAAEATNVSEST